MKTIIALFILFSSSFSSIYAQKSTYLEKAKTSLDSIYKYYGIQDSKLLREHYPFKGDFKADYLGGGENANKVNPYAYLWPYSGSFSAYVALYEVSKNKTVIQEIDNKVLTGLENYYDKREPKGYASYVNSAPLSDRFYDDNVWLGIDFTDLYLLTKEQKYLDKAKEVWAYVASGMDEKLGGGIYWCEQRKESKNTCSNAPSIVYVAKLYEATKENKYLELAKEIYMWTQSNLIDQEDHVYFDNINLQGQVDKRKYAYNSGQMIQAGALLYKITKDKKYLSEAQNVAKGTFKEFFATTENGNERPKALFKTSNNWFIAVMVRGFVELYKQDKNKTYVKAIQQNLDYAWSNMRATNGLFSKEWQNRNKKEDSKWLLDQFAMVEMYCRLTDI